MSGVEVFYSYAHKDEALRAELEKHLSLLSRQGLITAWHDREIIAGTDWTQDITTHLEQASIILLLISADFLASDYCYGIEMKRAMERHQANEARIIPILLRPVDWQSAPFSHLQVMPTNAKAITTWKNRDQAFTDVAASLRRAIEDLSLLEASAPRAILPSVWNIPYSRNSFFIGRDDLLSRVHTQFQADQVTAFSQPQAISGLGGIGKTQIAVEYAYRYHQDYQAVLWARAESQESLISSFVTLARLLKLPEQEAQMIIVETIKSWLQIHRQWLLILDNADDLTLIRDFLPPALGGHLLLTTRASALGRLAHRIEIDTLSNEQGAQMILQRSGMLAADSTLAQVSDRDRELATQISQELGGLPLALDQAGAYLEETGAGLSEYLQAYQLHSTELLKERRGLVADHPESVATTWALTFARVEERNPAAADLLRLCTFLAPDAIPEEIITQGTAYLGPRLALIAEDAFLFGQAMEALRAYSLIGRDPSTHRLSIHRLVQAVLKDTMDKQTFLQWAQRAVYAVNAAFPGVEFQTWHQCDQLLPHALVCAELIKDCNMQFSEAGRLLTQAGWYLKERALYIQSTLLLKRGLEIREKALGPEHLDVAKSLNELGRLYSLQRKDTEAKILLIKGLEIREKVLGPEHLDVAKSLNNLALLYHKQGKYEQAELLYARALAIREQQMGTNHPDTAQSLNNLALLYQRQGKYEQAERLCQRALAIYEQQVGTEHPDTATSLYNMARLYQRQGKYTEAEPLYQRALYICEQQLRPGHPLMQTVQRNYGSLLRVIGRDTEAIKLEENS